VDRFFFRDVAIRHPFFCSDFQEFRPANSKVLLVAQASASGGPGSANLPIGELQDAIQENGAPRLHTLKSAPLVPITTKNRIISFGFKKLPMEGAV
jgi:hypothetical protein